jgi:hypothetical protein
MNQAEDPRELQRQLELASRIASSVTDQTTIERLRAWIEHLKQKLRTRRDERRIRQEITVRAREIWEQNGRPPDRDVEFWLQAEFEIRQGKRE